MKLNYFFIPYLAIVLFILGGVLQSGGIAWYHTLTVPPWNPPDGIISLIWAVIYLCAGWSLLIVWNTLPHDGHFKRIAIIFAMAGLLNLLWSVSFFYLHLPLVASWCAVALAFLVALLASVLYRKSKRAALLLTPYIAWVSFAAYLNYVVSVLNP